MDKERRKLIKKNYKFQQLFDVEEWEFPKIEGFDLGENHFIITFFNLKQCLDWYFKDRIERCEEDFCDSDSIENEISHKVYIPQMIAKKDSYGNWKEKVEELLTPNQDQLLIDFQKYLKRDKSLEIPLITVTKTKKWKIVDTFEEYHRIMIEEYNREKKIAFDAIMSKGVSHFAICKTDVIFYADDI